MRDARAIVLALALLPAALLSASAALADDDTPVGLYAGGDVGTSSERFHPAYYSLRAQNTGYQVDAGWRPINVLAGEVNYVDLGRANAGINYADTEGIAVSALGFLPIPLVDLYGRVGLVDWRSDVHSPFVSFHRSGSDLTYGVGAGMHWGSLGARVEYRRYDMSVASTMSLASVGVTWTFL
jgi:hypothetical protein